MFILQYITSFKIGGFVPTFSDVDVRCVKNGLEKTLHCRVVLSTVGSLISDRRIS